MDKRRLLKTILCLCVVAISTSCGINNKESYLKSFEDFIVEIEEAKSFSKDDFTSIKKEYLDFTETYYYQFENELSSKDEKLILELKARYYAVMAKDGLKDMESALKDLGEQASDFINDILE